MPQLEHPVARVLALTVARHSLSKRWLLRSLAARVRVVRSVGFAARGSVCARVGQEADFSALQPDTVAAMQEYAERTASSLLYLYLESLGVRSVDADHAASHIGPLASRVHFRVGDASFVRSAHRQGRGPRDDAARHAAPAAAAAALPTRGHAPRGTYPRTSPVSVLVCPRPSV